MDYDDEHLRAILKRARVIACVGASTNPVRPSYFVARYLGMRGYRVIPVNPAYAGDRLFGEVVRPDLASIPADAGVDLLDVFRKPEAVPALVDEALACLPALKTVWMQIGVTSPPAAARAEAAGMTVIQDRCVKIEYQRLFGELRMGGFNTRIISSRL
jgi:predicted CoA-binding protein